jgi:hypothetical protein
MMVMMLRLCGTSPPCYNGMLAALKEEKKVYAKRQQD